MHQKKLLFTFYDTGAKNIFYDTGAQCAQMGCTKLRNVLVQSFIPGKTSPVSDSSAVTNTDSLSHSPVAHLPQPPPHLLPCRAAISANLRLKVPCYYLKLPSYYPPQCRAMTYAKLPHTRTTSTRCTCRSTSRQAPSLDSSRKANTPSIPNPL